ncbi:hypothetical protein BRADI_3g22502v3 [Brachypodium distachyon]|uniref:Uncharacterized protein n=1 Tax=Brachypodium distachyon TaxID=15368 RepID=A0A2K2CYU1_BRADI|nr:hypothetical protein BRADI_3g22502v3 [Brachypodium distachyon]
MASKKSPPEPSLTGLRTLSPESGRECLSSNNISIGIHHKDLRGNYHIEGTNWQLSYTVHHFFLLRPLLFFSKRRLKHPASASK